MERLFAAVRLASIVIAGAAVVMVLRTPEPPPEEAVRQAFAAYKRAVLANDGDTAVTLVSARTLEWYGKMQDLALHGSKQETAGLGPLEKIQVLAFRQRVPADELRVMSPRQLFVHAVAHSWFAKEGIQRSDLGAIRASDGAEVAQVLISGKDSGQQYHFVREDGRWLFDQLATLPLGNDAIKKAAAQRGITEDAFVVIVVESGSGKKTATDPWQPPFPRDATPPPQ